MPPEGGGAGAGWFQQSETGLGQTAGINEGMGRKKEVRKPRVRAVFFIDGN